MKKTLNGHVTKIRAVGFVTALMAVALSAGAPPIDRRAVVGRHNPHFARFDVESPVSVGNGEFAFTVDATGLQTFPVEFEKTIPLGTLSQWGWHTAPNPDGWSINRFRFTEFESHGRQVGYADIPGNRRTPEIDWLRANPHRLHLGRIGFRLTHADGSAGRAADVREVNQKLDLWEGIVASRFTFDGKPVAVSTVCHPAQDQVSVRVESPLLADGRLALELHFPYGAGAVATADWTKPEAHETTLVRPSTREARFDRRLDGDRYHVAARWAPDGTIREMERHRYLLTAGNEARALEFSCLFSPRVVEGKVAGFPETREAARQHWSSFWGTGGAVDLSGSHDPRWRELERRIVLSRYLTAIQCSGSLPPQETGLTYNSWEGKFHLEMHWWHAAHFALWEKTPMLERSLGYYSAILPRARETAARQGYRGARWPKMTGPTGAESPSAVGPFLIWQQPHPIYYAELCYRAHPDRATLERYRDVVFETADFMASFAAWDETNEHFVLGPPLQGAQEVFPKEKTSNTTFGLAYWSWGLEAAQAWRERLGQEREARWDRVISHLSPLPVAEGRYLFAATAPDSYSDPRFRRDHPSVAGILGILPGKGVDRETMVRTFDWIWENWTWADTWGWDYPMMAMCAARLGKPERAVDALLLDTPKNRYRANGHNHQRPGLTIYLPGNGGLLAAVAMMAAGWDGAPRRNAPGFPADGQWDVRWENLHPMP